MCFLMACAACAPVPGWTSLGSALLDGDISLLVGQLAVPTQGITHQSTSLTERPTGHQELLALLLGGDGQETLLRTTRDPHVDTRRQRLTCLHLVILAISFCNPILPFVFCSPVAFCISMISKKSQSTQALGQLGFLLRHLSAEKGLLEVPTHKQYQRRRLMAHCSQEFPSSPAVTGIISFSSFQICSV